MWTDTVIRVGERDVTLSLVLLEPEQREPVAASVAWLATASAQPAAALEHAGWHALIENVLAPYIAFTVDHEDPMALGGEWWDLALRQATLSFIRANQLEMLVRRFMSSLEAQTQVNGTVS